MDQLHTKSFSGLISEEIEYKDLFSCQFLKQLRNQFNCRIGWVQIIEKFG